MPYQRPGVARSGALLIIAAVVPVLVFAGFSAIGVYGQRQTELRNQALAEARRMLEAVDRELSNSLDHAEALAAQPALDSPADVPAFAEIARREQVRHPLWRTILLLAPSGTRLVNTLTPTNLGAPVEVESFKEVIRTRQPVVGLIARGPQEFGIPLRAPVIRNSEVVGVVTIVLRPGGVEKLVQNAGLPSDWIITVVDGEGRVVARSHNSLAFLGKAASPAAREARMESDRGIYDGMTLEGVRTVSAFWQSKVTGWSVHIGVPRKALEDPLNRSIAFTAAGCALSLLLAAVFASLLTRELRLRRQESLALEQSHRLEALGRLTGGVAHDFNNLLMIIQGNAETLQRRVSLASAKRPLAAIRDATDRASRLTRELLVFARGGSAERTVIDLNAAIRDFMETVTQAVGPHVHVEGLLDADAGAVEVDRVQFEMALLNIAVNARDAMNGVGEIRITTARLARGRVEIRITDSGPGVAPNIAGRVFDPFFTTKAPGSGTGLGLTQVYSFAKQSGGLAKIASGERGGAVVIIELPVSTQAVEPSGLQNNLPGPNLNGRKVLLLDDNQDVRSVTAEHLREAGADVFEGASAVEGLGVLEDMAFDLVISDIVMPGEMDGLALAEIARTRRPNIPYLLVSGYSESTSEALSRGFRVLRKPFSLAELDAVVVDLLRIAPSQVPGI